jgi:hypothetical protein
MDFPADPDGSFEFPTEPEPSDDDAMPPCKRGQPSGVVPFDQLSEGGFWFLHSITNLQRKDRGPWNTNRRALVQMMAVSMCLACSHILCYPARTVLHCTSAAYGCMCAMLYMPYVLIGLHGPLHTLAGGGYASHLKYEMLLYATLITALQAACRSWQIWSASQGGTSISSLQSSHSSC